MSPVLAIQILLRLTGWVCLIALIPLFMPRSWIVQIHSAIGLGEFPAAPIAEYLARGMSAMCAFYGGLLLLLARDVLRYRAIIKFQALAIMGASLCGLVLGTAAGMPFWMLLLDSILCGSVLLPILLLLRGLNTALG